MDDLRFTLIGDGRFDRALVPLLVWLLHDLGVTVPVQPYWADLGRLPKPPRRLNERIVVALDLYPCELLFLHRDAEGRPASERRAEILRAVRAAARAARVPAHVAVVPVRMTEAWLLFDENLIRAAAGNPSGTDPLGLPPRSRWETIADPKQQLHQILLKASGLRGRRRAKFDASSASIRVAELASDFSALRTAKAFQELEASVLAAVKSLGLVA